MPRPYPSMQLRLAFALVAFLTIRPALADIPPYPPKPPQPPGPASATIRGVTMQYQFGYWRGRRWLVAVSGCASGTPACKGRDLADCVVMLGDGSVPTIADLVAADKKAGSGPLQLRIERCAASAASNDLSL